MAYPYDATSEEITKYRRIGTAAMVLGVLVGIAGAVFAHYAALPLTDDLGQDLFPQIPRGWYLELLGQIISLGGALVFMGGMALAVLYERPMTWARAAIGAGLFTGLMIILFGIVPNQWLTLTQSVWEWTPQKIFLTIPPPLVLGSEIEISYAALKDMVSGTYVLVVTGAVAVVMYQWQERQKRAATGPPPQPVSRYGRPLTRARG